MKVLFLDNPFGLNPHSEDIEFTQLLTMAENPIKTRKKGFGPKSAALLGEFTYETRPNKYTGDPEAINKKCINRTIGALDCDDRSDGDAALRLLWGYFNTGDHGEIETLIYTTATATEKNFKHRILFPFSRPVTPEEYKLIMRAIIIDLEFYAAEDLTYIIDPHSITPTQIMYMPAEVEEYDAELDCWDIPDEREYAYDYIPGEPLNVEAMLYWIEVFGADYNDDALKPVSGNDEKKTSYYKGKNHTDYDDFDDFEDGDPRNKNSIVGSFCRAYSITEAIELIDNWPYEECGSKWKLIGSHSPAGAHIKNDDTLFYSLHATDEYSGRDLNAYDLVLYYQFEGNAQKMYEWAKSLPEIKELEHDRMARNYGWQSA